jgi:hypothetical protein
MRARSEIRYIRHFLGLGVAGELSVLCDDRVMWMWTNLHIKVYLGPWIWLINLPVSRRRKAVLNARDIKIAQEDR